MQKFSPISVEFQSNFSWISVEFQLKFSRISVELQPNFSWISAQFQPNFSWISVEFQPNFSPISVEFQSKFSRISAEIQVKFNWNSAEIQLKLPRSKLQLRDLYAFHKSQELTPDGTTNPVPLRPDPDPNVRQTARGISVVFFKVLDRAATERFAICYIITHTRTHTSPNSLSLLLFACGTLHLITWTITHDDRNGHITLTSSIAEPWYHH